MYWDMAELPHPKDFNMAGDFTVIFSNEDADML
jgi:hypothetical protein